MDLTVGTVGLRNSGHESFRTMHVLEHQHEFIFRQLDRKTWTIWRMPRSLSALSYHKTRSIKQCSAPPITASRDAHFERMYRTVQQW